MAKCLIQFDPVPLNAPFDDRSYQALEIAQRGFSPTKAGKWGDICAKLNIWAEPNYNEMRLIGYPFLMDAAPSIDYTQPIKLVWRSINHNLYYLIVMTTKGLVFHTGFDQSKWGMKCVATGGMPRLRASSKEIGEYFPPPMNLPSLGERMEVILKATPLHNYLQL